MFGSESAEDHRNRMATDIVECENCDSEKVTVVEVARHTEPDYHTHVFLCADCGRLTRIDD